MDSPRPSDSHRSVVARIIVAIDGPSGCGKGTIAKLVAERLGLLHIDSGAMYRAVALLAVEGGVPLDDGIRLGELASDGGVHFESGEAGVRIFAGERDINEAIRRPEVSEAASHVAVHREVRSALVARQQAMGTTGDVGVVMEGRDIGTVVFPQAELKIFLDASPEERARRRYIQDGAESGGVTLQETLDEILERDRRDRERSQSPLLQAKDAVYIDTTAMSREDVADVIVRLARQRGAASD